MLGCCSLTFEGDGSSQARLPDLPRQDLLALGLIAGIVVVGFILEGMRIAMTGFPEGSSYAFVGYSIGRLFFTASSAYRRYGYVWYLHAILTGASSLICLSAGCFTSL